MKQLSFIADRFTVVYRRWPEQRWSKRNRRMKTIWNIAYYVQETFDDRPLKLHGPYPHKDIARSMMREFYDR